MDEKRGRQRRVGSFAWLSSFFFLDEILISFRTVKEIEAVGDVGCAIDVESETRQDEKSDSMIQSSQNQLSPANRQSKAAFGTIDREFVVSSWLCE